MNFLINLFLDLDYLGLPVNFKLNKRDTFKTQIGSISSIAIVILIAFSFTLLVQDIKDGMNITTMSTQADIKPEDSYTFNEKEFDFVVAVTNSIGQLIMNSPGKSFYYVLYSYCTKIGQDAKCIESIAEPCDQSHVEFWNVSMVNIRQKFDVPEEGIRASYCMSKDFKDQVKEFKLQGHHRTNIYSDITVQVRKCLNGNSFKIKCASEGEIESKLSNGNLAYGYTFYTYQGNSLQQPYQLRAEVGLAKIQALNHKLVYLLYKYSQTVTKYNFFYFLPNYETISSVEFAGERMESFVQMDSDSIIIEVTVKFDSQKQLHQRNQDNILDVFAKIGGLFSLLKITVSIIISPIQRIQLKLFIYNELNRKKKVQHKLNVIDIVKSKQARDQILLYFQQVEQNLDLVEVISQPIQFTQQVLDLRSSMPNSDRINMANRDDQVIHFNEKEEGAQAVRKLQINSGNSSRVSHVENQFQELQFNKGFIRSGGCGYQDYQDI